MASDYVFVCLLEGRSAGLVLRVKFLVAYIISCHHAWDDSASRFVRGPASTQDPLISRTGLQYPGRAEERSYARCSRALHARPRLVCFRGKDMSPMTVGLQITSTCDDIQTVLTFAFEYGIQQGRQGHTIQGRLLMTNGGTTGVKRGV